MGYFLDERRNWALNLEELQRSLKEAREEGKLVRGLVFINPGNPTGESRRRRSRRRRSFAFRGLSCGARSKVRILSTPV